MFPALAIHCLGSVPEIGRQIATFHLNTYDENIVDIYEFFGRERTWLKPDEVYYFTVNLELMLTSGINLARCLEILSESNMPGFDYVCDQLFLAVASGSTLSQAMSRQARTFSSSYCRIVHTGELTGQLTACLRRLAYNYRRQTEIQRTLKKALTYPAVLLLASAVMVGLVLYLVFPMIIRFTLEAGIEPPAITKVVMKLASPKILTYGTGSVFLAWCLYKFLMSEVNRANRMREFFEKWTPMGRFIARREMLIAVRQFALMLECGMDVLLGLRNAGRIGEKSILVFRGFKDIERRVRDGESLSEGFAAHPVFTRTLPPLVEVAEEVGELHRTIYQFCGIIEDQIEDRIKAASSALEPLLMGGMGFIVGFILLAAFLPVYQLVTL